MTEHPATAMPIKYSVSCLPIDHPEHRHFELYVEWRGKDRWAVTDGFSNCLNSDGEWDYEMMPSERTDEWLANHRFDQETALKLAAEKSPKIEVAPGYTVKEALEQYKAVEK